MRNVSNNKRRQSEKGIEFVAKEGHSSLLSSLATTYGSYVQYEMNDALMTTRGEV